MFCLPRVSKAEFPALKVVMAKSFPQHYDQWVDVLSDWCLELGMDGVVPIEVKAEAFSSYMSGADRQLGLQDLLDFAAFNPWHDPNSPAAPKLARP